jgi:hypothetical protein
MDNQHLISIEKIKENLFKIIYLILLIVLLALIVINEEKKEADAQTKLQNEQFVKEN